MPGRTDVERLRNSRALLRHVQGLQGSGGSVLEGLGVPEEEQHLERSQSRNHRQDHVGLQDGQREEAEEGVESRCGEASGQACPAALARHQ